MCGSDDLLLYLIFNYFAIIEDQCRELSIDPIADF